MAGERERASAVEKMGGSSVARYEPSVRADCVAAAGVPVASGVGCYLIRQPTPRFDQRGEGRPAYE